MSVFTATLVALGLSAWLAVPIYAWKTRHFHRTRWRTIFVANLLLSATVGLGSIIMLSVLRNNVVKKKIELHKFTEYRQQFLADYPERLAELQAKLKMRVSPEERERQFLELNPGTVLRRAPRNATEFEQICANWLRLWGETNVKVTQKSGDGGLDIISARFGGQVKFYADKPVGRPEVQQLYGAAVGNGLSPLFFSYSNGYTPQALEWAAQSKIACFTFIPQSNHEFAFEANTIEAANLCLESDGLTFVDYEAWRELDSQYEFLLKNEVPPATNFSIWQIWGSMFGSSYDGKYLLSDDDKRIL